MHRLHVLLCAFALAFGFSLSAKADTFIYTLTMTADGSLGSTSFTNTLVTYTLTGDTANIIASLNSYELDGIPGTVTVAGLGTYNITSSLQLQADSSSNPSNAFVNLYSSSNNGLDFYVWDPALNGYTLGTTIGPVNAAPNYAAGAVETTGGTLNVTSSETADTTFQAALPVVPATTPEPSSWMLLSTGVVGVGSMARRRCAARG